MTDYPMLKKHQETETIIKEHGFRRIILRKGKIKQQKTEILMKNPLKVTLEKIGDLELYCYPFDYPEHVFIGLGNQTQTLNKYQVKMFLGMHNKARWFLNGDWQKEPKRKGEVKKRRCEVLTAYNLGLKRQMEAKRNADKT